MTELIVDAIEYVKNPYKGKKLKVMNKNFKRSYHISVFSYNFVT